jgi:hypothetical protein
MPRKAEPPTLDFDERDDVIRDLERRLEKVQALLEEREQQAAAMADEIESMRDMPSDVKHPFGDTKHGMFMLILAVLILGRMVIYGLFERVGQWDFTLAATIIFAIPGVAVFIMGVWKGWQEIQWLIIPKVMVISICLVATTIDHDPENHLGLTIIRQIPDIPDSGTLLSGCIAVASLLFAASPAIELGMVALHTFLRKPLAPFKNLIRKSRPKR